MSTWIDKLAQRIDGHTEITPESVEQVLEVSNMIRKARGEKELTLSEAVASARAFRASPEYHQAIESARRKMEDQEAALRADWHNPPSDWRPGDTPDLPSATPPAPENPLVKPQPRTPLPANVVPIRRRRPPRSATYSYLQWEGDD